MQFTIITHSNSHRFPTELAQFFRARHQVYAEELNWVPRSNDGMEYDAYDTEAADYLVMRDEQGFVAGSRLVPTHLPHLLADVFPDSCNLRAMPRDPAVAEWTRGFIIPSRRDKSSVRILAQACAAVMEHCLAVGYSQVGGIQDMKWLPLWKKMGWSIHIHGDPIDIDGAPWLPVYFDVAEDAMLAARALGRLPGPVLSDLTNSRAA